MIALAIFVMLVYPLVKSFNDAAQAEFRHYVDNMGVFGFAAIFAMQVLQVVVAVIPGAIVQFAAGYMYSPWLGLAICLAGVYTGQVIVFRLVRRFGHNLVEAVSDGEKLKKWSFIRNEKKLELIAFILFVIPGTPKDLFCYIFPLTAIEEKRFMIISVIGRIPAIITSIYAADYIYDGDYIKAGIIWGIVMLVSGGAIIAGSLIMKRHKSRKG